MMTLFFCPCCRPPFEIGGDVDELIFWDVEVSVSQR